MKIRSEIIWATLLVVTAVIFFYLGNKTGAMETEEDLSVAIDRREERISALESKIEQLADELTSRGIYSYPQANVISKKGDPSATVLISLNGREAIRNLEIQRKLFYNYSAATNSNEPAANSITRSSIGNLNAHNPVAFSIPVFEREVAIDLTFRSDRNEWHQYIWAQKTPKGEIKVFWVITNQENEVIDKHIDEAFPMDEEGNIKIGPEENLKYSGIRMNSIFKPKEGK